MAGYQGNELNKSVKIVDIDKYKGRGLFAKRSFVPGEVIFEEQPLVSSQFLWNELYKYRACEMCLRSLETASEAARRLSGNDSVILPHPDCCTVDPLQHSQCPHCAVSYCSEACREKAWNSHHAVLCTNSLDPNSTHPLNELCETWRNMHYPPETASIILVCKMIAIIKQSKDHKSLLNIFSQFCHNPLNEETSVVHKLLGPQFQEQLEILRTMVADCLHDEKVGQWLTEDGFRSLFALIGTNGQGIGSSSLSIWVKNCEALSLPANEKAELDAFIDQLYDDIDKVSGMFLNCEGSGLYQVQSAINHSCVPNAEIAFHHGDHTLSLVALRGVGDGEEICISYLSECDLERSRYSRHKTLRENYLFVCDCSKCLSQADDDDITSDEDMDDTSDD